MNNTEFRQKVRDLLAKQFAYVGADLQALNAKLAVILQLDLPSDSWMRNHFPKDHLHEVVLEIYEWIECERPIPSVHYNDEFYTAVLEHSILGKMVRIFADKRLQWRTMETINVIVHDTMVPLSAMSHRLIFLEELCTWIDSVKTAQAA